MKNTNISSPEAIDTLRGDHLTDKKDTILTCVHGDSNTDFWLKENESKMGDDIFYYKPGVHNRASSRDVGIFKTVLEEYDYCSIISQINTRNKFSKGYYDCTGIVAIGKDKETGENISFLTHQHPMYLLGELPKEKFKQAVNATLEILRERSVQGSIDIVILGGIGYLTWSEDRNFAEKSFGKYTKIIEGLSDIIFSIMGFYPVAVCSPGIFRSNDGSKDIFIDTQKRQIHFLKPTRKNDCNVSYVANKVTEVLDQIKDE